MEKGVCDLSSLVLYFAFSRNEFDDAVPCQNNCERNCATTKLRGPPSNMLFLPLRISKARTQYLIRPKAAPRIKRSCVPQGARRDGLLLFCWRSVNAEHLKTLDTGQWLSFPAPFEDVSILNETKRLQELHRSGNNIVILHAH